MKSKVSAAGFVCCLLTIFAVMYATPCLALVTGTVKDTSGIQVSSALVTFTDESNPENEYSDYTDSSGKYELPISYVYVEDEKPSSFQLHQNYPNPFNPSTTIPYFLEKAGYVNLSIYNITGQKVRTLINNYQSAGSHNITWDGFDDNGKSTGTGLYIYQLRSGENIESKKMLLLDGGSVSSYPDVSNQISAKAVSETGNSKYRVTITADDIEPYEESGITITSGKTYDFNVSRTEPITTPDGSTISETTFVVENNTKLVEETVTDNTLTYSYSGKTPDIETGDVIVSGEGTGYLRKVTAVSVAGDKVTLQTEQAALTDVVENGTFTASETLEFTAEKITGGILKSAANIEKIKNGVAFTDVSIFSDTDDGAAIEIKLDRGSIVFEPHLDLEGVVENKEVQYFHAILSGDIAFSFDISGSASKAVSIATSRVDGVYPEEITLAQYRYIAYQQIGPVPVIEVITLSFNAGFELVANAAGHIKSGFTYTDTIQLGAIYEEDEWSPVFGKDPKFIKHETDWKVKGGAYVKIYVRPEISIKLYKVAGPYMDVVPYLDFTGTIGGDYDWYWEIGGGIDSNLGFDVSVMGTGIANYSTKLIERRMPEPIDTGFKEKSGGGTHETHGITFVSIPGGTFEMGDEVGDLWSGCRHVHTVTVSGFDMSTTEITNAQYAVYLNEALTSGDIEVESGDVYGKTGEWSGERYLDIGYEYNSNNKCWISYSNGTFTVTSGKENWPVVAVTWYGSKAFALYYGLDLPREAELEYAARGGKQYKYGTDDGTISDSKANYDWNIGYLVDAGSYPANPFGLYDMSGNVWEWCNDWYGDYSSESASNPTGAQIGSLRVIRGGSWGTVADGCRSAYRGDTGPGDRDYSVGFRVVSRWSSHE